MLRRRGLSGFFKFGIKGPSDTKYNVNDISISYDYGKTKVIEYTELGTVIGTYVNYTTVIEEDNKEYTYYKLNGKGPGTVNIAILNFTTYINNQTITLKVKEICDSENDFLAVCHLDATDKDHIKAKITKNESKTITFDVVNKGSHFIKIYYYQHNDNTVENEGYPNDPPHSVNSDEHYGCFRLEPWKYTYKEAYDIDAYDKPGSQSIYIRSYYGWDVVNKSNLPAWVQLNMTEAKQGNKKLDITLAANHGIQRTYNLVIRERKDNTEITISISQSANPHPNDILLNINNASTTSDANSVTNIDVKLIGLDSYIVQGPNTDYRISQTEYTLIIDEQSGDGAYIDMPVKENTLTITKKNTGNVNPATFTINGLNVNGTNVMRKNIVINSDKVSCYCDCNQYNRCQCEVEEFINKKELVSCTSYSYDCPQHCTTNTNFCPSNTSDNKCTGHSVCACDCQGHDPCDSKTTCPSVGVYTCPSQCDGKNRESCSHCGHNVYTCNCDCNTNGCSCYGQCNYTSCSCDCNTNACSCYGQCSHTSCSCDCNTNNMTCSHGSCTCNSNTYPTQIRIWADITMHGANCPTYENPNAAIGTVVTYIKFFLYNSSSATTESFTRYYGEPVHEQLISGKEIIMPYKYKNWTILYIDLLFENGTVFAGDIWQGDNYSINDKLTDNYSYAIGVTGRSPRSKPASSSSFCTPEAFPMQTSCPRDTCKCNGDRSICSGHCSNTVSTSNTSCGGHCGNTVSTSNTSCTGHCNHWPTTCSCNGNCNCNGNCPSHCPSYSYGCPGNACNCNTKVISICSDCKTDCTCNTKIYYPYCQCETNCECYNYTFPEECYVHNCKADEINSCTCNSQVTCPPKS